MATTTRSLVLVLAAVALVAGCGSTGDRAGAGTDHLDAVRANPAALSYVAGQAVGYPEGAVTIGIARTIPELLPNRRFQGFGDAYATNSQSVVVGRPVDVRPGSATIWGDGDDRNPDGARTVPFDDPTAQGRSWRVDLEVDDLVTGVEPSVALKGANDRKVTLEFRSAGGPLDIDTFRSGLLAMGPSVWFLDAEAGGPKDTFEAAWNSTAIAQVGKDGTLTFPLLTPERRKEIREEDYTVDALRKLGREPIVVIPMGAGG